jgi:hypothetical protein
VTAPEGRVPSTPTDHRLRELIRAREMLRVTIRPPVAENVTGIPLAFSETLLLVWAIRDFQPGGYAVFPRRSIASFRSGRFERFVDRVLIGEGLTRRVRTPAHVDIASMRALFEGLRRRRQNIIVETAVLARTAAPDESCFHLGRITSVADDAVSLRTVTALGRWDRRARRINFESVECVQFADPYTRTYSKYAPFPET